MLAVEIISSNYAVVDSKDGYDLEIYFERSEVDCSVYDLEADIANFIMRDIYELDTPRRGRNQARKRFLNNRLLPKSISYIEYRKSSI